MNRFESKRNQSINTLLDSALMLFSENGYEATSIRSIAKNAGVSLGLLYNYFGSKEELVQEIIQRNCQQIRETFAVDDTNAESGTLTLEHHITQIIQRIKAQKPFWKLLHSLRQQSGLGQRILATMQEQTAFIESHLKEHLFAAGIPFPDLEAKLLMASIDGITSHYLLDEKYPINDVASLLLMKYKKTNA